MAQNAEDLDNNYKEAYQQAYQLTIKNEVNEFKAILDIAQQLHEVYTDTLKVSTTNWYFITIRPDQSKINLYEFLRLCEKYVKRKCFKDFTLTFEQKGQTLEDLGNGFHCHIVADSTWRSKGEALRDTISTFNKCCAANCIEIKPTRNPDNIIENYMINYKSEDGHKEVTKQWDYIWRENNNLKSLYRPDDTILSSSPVTESKSVYKSSEIITWD